MNCFPIFMDPHWKHGIYFPLPRTLFSLISSVTFEMLYRRWSFRTQKEKKVNVLKRKKERTAKPEPFAVSMAKTDKNV